jgi:hypothetical protein
MIEQKQLENVEYFSYLGSMIRKMHDVHMKLNPRLSMAKRAFDRKNSIFTSKFIVNLRNKQVKCYTWSIAL